MKPSTNWQIGVTPATTTNLVGYSDTSDDDYSDPKRIYLDEVENLNLLLDDRGNNITNREISDSGSKYYVFAKAC